MVESFLLKNDLMSEQLQKDPSKLFYGLPHVFPVTVFYSRKVPI